MTRIRRRCHPRRAAGAALGLIAALATGCERPPPAPDILATWNGPEDSADNSAQISAEDLDHFLLALPPAQRAPGPQEEVSRWLRDHLDRLFERQALVTEDAIATLDDDPQFQATLEANARPALARLWLAERNERFEITLDEAQAFYDERPESWKSPGRRGFYHLLLAFPPEAGDAEKQQVCERAEELRRQALGGASFEELVRRHSDSSNAESGGLVGPVTRRQLRGEVGEVIFSLEIGEVSPVVRTGAGCQLFQLRQALPAIDAAFETVADRIVRGLADERRQELYQRLLDERVAAEGLTLPEPLAAGERIEDPQTVLFESGEIRITAQAVAAAQRATPGVGFDAALRTLIGDALFARAQRQEQPEVTEERLAQLRQRVAMPFLYRASRQAFAEEAVGEEELRSYYESHKSRYLTDPQVELALISWPLAAGDPVRSLARPRQLAQTLEGGSSLEEAWSRFSGDAGIERESVPLTGLRELLARRPNLVPSLQGEIVEGAASDPFPVATPTGDTRVAIHQIVTYIPPRQGSFLEVRPRLLVDYTGDESVGFARRWSEHLQADYDYRVYEAHLVAFGDRLVERLGEQLGAPPTAGVTEVTEETEDAAGTGGS